MIGIFGGAFDPVHLGHLKTIQYVLEQCQLEQIRLIPLANTVHKEQPLATPTQRVQMLQAAIASFDQFIVDEREVERKGSSYTVDTLKSLKKDLPDKNLCLILGADAFNHFLSWREPEVILELANIVIMQRPNSPFSPNQEMKTLLKQHQAKDLEELKQSAAGSIYFQDVPQLAISSTQIREHISKHQDVSSLLPESVFSLIKKWKLYQM